MLFGLVVLVHVLIALFLIGVILLQGGRGGLGEALGGAAAQSLFGGGANTVMTRLTSICAGLFMVTCLSLAGLSTARGRSVIDRLPMSVDELPGVLPGEAGGPSAPIPTTAGEPEARPSPAAPPQAPAPAAPPSASPPSAAPAQPATPAPSSSSTTP